MHWLIWFGGSVVTVLALMLTLYVLSGEGPDD